MNEQIVDIINEFNIFNKDVHAIHSIHDKTHDLYIVMASANVKIFRIISGQMLSQALHMKSIVLEVLDDMHQDLAALQ